MRFFTILAASLITFLLVMPTAANQNKAPIVVELFTSQGCSSCPPADRLLAELADDPDLITLSWHVTYWNYLGWKDPHAMDASDARQKQYATWFSARNVYTPQIVVGGSKEMVGSATGKVKAAIESAQSQTLFPLALSKKDNDKIEVTLPAILEPDLMLVLIGYHDSAKNAVPRGENAGATLSSRHTVTDVRYHDVTKSPAAAMTFPKPMGAHAVALLQNKNSGVILGAGKL